MGVTSKDGSDGSEGSEGKEGGSDRLPILPPEPQIIKDIPPTCKDVIDLTVPATHHPLNIFSF